MFFICLTKIAPGGVWRGEQLSASALTMTQPAFDTLPIELALHILLQCTAILVVSDRPRATQIALVSRATFTTVAPVLYHTLVLTRKNILDSNEEAFPVETFDRLLPHVRHLAAFGPCFNDDRMDWLGDLLKRWQPPPCASLFLDVPWYPTNAFFRAKPDAHVTGIRITYNSLNGSLSQEHGPKQGYQQPLAPDVCHRLTHVVGWIPTVDDLKGWAHSIVSSLPALTHLGLQVVELRSQQFNRTQFHAVRSGLADLIREFLNVAEASSPKIECICLRFAGLVIEDESDRDILRGIADTVRDERLKIWLDQRFPKELPPKEVVDDDDDQSSWDGRWDDLDDEMDFQDAATQRDFWNPESRPDAIVYQFTP